MSPTYSATGRQRRLFVPSPTGSPAGSVPPPQPQDPPIYRDMMRTWADRGRTLPGRHDPEWVRLAALPVSLGRISGPQAPPGDGR
ncbi:hypothetical protein [Streptomyces sp. V3I7]|uniref:hypothetical protein n=1 Tax=Streptomyces sp. V3I7 TaxID=3042278 RepID=UPI0027D8F1A6|nr:hypothetical protein [Streptomyces sp. V3I7]